MKKRTSSFWEIGTFKEEEINRGVLEDIKKKLLSMWRDKPEKEKAAENVEKTYAVINSAVQLKGLMSLYNKHKKELASAVSKIKKILKNIPADSQAAARKYVFIFQDGY